MGSIYLAHHSQKCKYQEHTRHTLFDIGVLMSCHHRIPDRRKAFCKIVSLRAAKITISLSVSAGEMIRVGIRVVLEQHCLAVG
jgi:hypothetical protein